MELGKMNGTQRIAFANIKGVFDWEVGGWYNCIQDGCPEYIPDTLEDAKELIYEEALNDLSRPGFYAVGRAPREMRFAGTEFLHACLDWLFETDGDAAAIAEEKGWK